MIPRPPWLVVERGGAPVLLLAPHGGRRRDRRIPGRHKVNDLYTADVTRILARLLDASVVINEHVDRNELDLNRTSQVRRDAPWLLDVVAEMLDRMVADAGRATVLVIHGWNVSQVACDVGIGVRETAEGLVAVRPGSATASDAFVAGWVRPLQARAGAEGIAVTVGSRYPAAHPNNLLQLFRRDGRPNDEVPCPLASVCDGGVIDAAQLELAIPLRWPGRRRDRFLTLLAATVGAFAGARPVVSRPFTRRVFAAGGGRVTRRRGLQLASGDLFVMASIEGGEAGATTGRVVVSERPDRLALFTGELVDPARPWSVPPLTCDCGLDGTMRLVYAGPLVGFSTHLPFLDLERGLAAGALVEGSLDLRFRRHASGHVSADGEALGEVHGEIVIDGRRYVVASRALATQTDRPLRARVPHGRIVLPDSVSGPVLLVTDALESSGAAHRWHARALSGLRWTDDGCVAVRGSAVIDVSLRAGTLLLECADAGPAGAPRVATLERIIPVRRPGPQDSIVETRWAVVRDSGRAVGWLEMSVLIGAGQDVSAV